MAERLARQDIERIVRSVLESYFFADFLKEEVLTLVVKAAESAIGQPVANPAAFRRYWLDRAYSPDGVTLSARINELSKGREIFAIVRKSMDIRQRFSDVAAELYRSGSQKGDVPAAIRELLKYSRQAASLAHDPELAKDFRSTLNKAQRGINRLIDPGKSKLARAYQDVVDAAEKQSWTAVEKAAHWASYHKAKYNSDRILNTEGARAYGQARRADAIANPNVSCLQFTLNSEHPYFDICDFLATADQYGYGPGIFPKGHGPDFPPHPGCWCMLDDVSVDQVPEASGDDFDPDRGQEHLSRLSEEQRRQFLGRKGAAAFEENPSSWRDHAKGYEDPKKQKATIPAKILFGK